MDRQHLSILDRTAVREAVAGTDLVFNCAAYNAVDRAESEPDVAMAVNAQGPAILADACAEAGARLVHFSTNFVFDGRAPEPYDEGSVPNPLGAYARSKLEGERAVLGRAADALVIRSSGLFGAGGSAIKGGSFPARIAQRARAGGPVRVVSDQRLNPTATADLAVAAVRLASEAAAGVIHVVAGGCCTWHEFAVATLTEAGIDAQVEAIASADLGTAAARPANGCLVSQRTAPLRPWREALADFIRSGAL